MPLPLLILLQLTYNLLPFRHSTMIVGKTGSGKSVSWQMLQLVLSAMKKEGVSGYNLVKVNMSQVTVLECSATSCFNKLTPIFYWCVAAFVSLCDHSHIPIASPFSRSPCCFARCVKTGKHVMKYTSNTNTRTLSLVCSLPFIAVSNRFSLCLDHCFRSF